MKFSDSITDDNLQECNYNTW